MGKTVSDREYAILNKNIVSRSLFDNLDSLGILDCIKCNIREASIHIDKPASPAFDLVLKVLLAHNDRATILVNQIHGDNLHEFLIVIHFSEQYADVLKPDLSFTSIYFSIWVLDGVKFEIPKEVH